MQNISEIEELIKLISRLPGLGPKSAKRIVLKLINNRDELVKPLAKALAEVYKNISRCKICGTLKPISTECSFNNPNLIADQLDSYKNMDNDNMLKVGPIRRDHPIENLWHNNSKRDLLI